jgi:hypothetical protein
MFRQICEMNHVWQHCYKSTFPVLHNEMSLKPEFDRKGLDWQSETKKNLLYLTAFKQIIEAMNENKEKGNILFRA